MLFGILVMMGALMHRVEAQGFSGNPLDSLAQFFPESPAATKCIALPDSLLEAGARRGLTLCGPEQGSLPRYVVFKDSTGVVHGFDFSGRITPSAQARRDAEQLVFKLAARFGPPVSCIADRWIWLWRDGRMEVKFHYETDFIKVDDPSYGDGRAVVLDAEWQLTRRTAGKNQAPCDT